MHKLKHLLYAGGWKKFEPLWNLVIKTRNLNSMLPLLESILAKVKTSEKSVEKDEKIKFEPDAFSITS